MPIKGTKSPSRSQNQKGFLRHNLHNKYLKINDFIIKTGAPSSKTGKGKSKLALLNENYASIPKQAVYANTQGPAHQFKQSAMESFFKSKQSIHPIVMPHFSQTNRKVPIHKFQILPGNNSTLVHRVFLEGCPKRALVWHEMGNK